MQWLNQSADDGWDAQMKRDGKAGKFDKLMHEAEADYREGRTTSAPVNQIDMFDPLSSVS